MDLDGATYSSRNVRSRITERLWSGEGLTAVKETFVASASLCLLERRFTRFTSSLEMQFCRNSLFDSNSFFRAILDQSETTS